MRSVDVETQPDEFNLIFASAPAPELGRRARRKRALGAASVALPIVAAAAAGWLVLLGRRRGVVAGVLGAALGLGLARWQLARLVTEQPPYEVEGRLGAIEIRRYAPQLLAQTVVEQTSWNRALREGFRRVAAYIFGENEARAKIPMTAPVLGSLPAIRPSRPGAKDAPPASHTVSFIMPSDRVLDTLPRPNDRGVSFCVLPSRRVAVLRFRGRYGGARPAHKRLELLRLVREAGLRPRGEVTFAGYDAPWTAPPLRRNEVLVELEEDEARSPGARALGSIP